MRGTIPPGTVFAADYVVHRELARGGMGAVYAAQHQRTQNMCALKIIVEHKLTDDDSRQRFEQEAMVGSLIKSEHKVEVFAAGVDKPTDTPWIAMELLEGETLESYVRNYYFYAPGDRPLPLERIHTIMEQLFHCIGAAHRAGVVHRDLKPANIFIARTNRVGSRFMVKVLDFGIAKLLCHGLSTPTRPIGSQQWMAPEQTVGDGEIAFATDVWACGLIAFWLLTGRSFWKSGNSAPSSMKTPNFFEEIHQKRYPNASARAVELGCAHALPAGFSAWFDRCVAYDHKRRFVDAEAAWLGWKEWIGGAIENTIPFGGIMDMSKPPSAARESTDQKTRNSPWRLVAGLGGSLVLGLILLAATYPMIVKQPGNADSTPGAERRDDLYPDTGVTKSSSGGSGGNQGAAATEAIMDAASDAFDEEMDAGFDAANVAVRLPRPRSQPVPPTKKSSASNAAAPCTCRPHDDLCIRVRCRNN